MDWRLVLAVLWLTGRSFSFVIVFLSQWDSTVSYVILLKSNTPLFNKPAASLPHFNLKIQKCHKVLTLFSLLALH